MMTMDFFGSQDRAKHLTRVLVGLFAVMTIVIVLVINMAASILFPVGQSVVRSQVNQSLNQSSSVSAQSRETIQMTPFHWEVWTVATPITILVILGGTLYSLYELRAGGPAVARMMGGREITHQDQGELEKRLVNVVDEMSIASGCPPPRVYIMDHEHAINAFAAGYSLDSSVVAVTRGCLMMLNRDELQGVVAHEFSHILNGDMRLNLRMLGLINGLSVISNTGYYLVMFGLLGRHGYSGYDLGSRGTSRESGNGAFLLALLAFGVVLYIVGYVGVLGGSVLKAAVSRQREFLADAAAVQFTRNPEGIGGALKKIGGFSSAGRLKGKHSASLSHMMFACGVSSWMNGLLSTHPGLGKRIKAIEPGWDGFYTTVEYAENGQPIIEEAPKASAQDRLLGMFNTDEDLYALADPVMDTMPGQLNPGALLLAQQMLAQIPSPIIAAAHVPEAAEAIIYALIYDKKDVVARKKQQAMIQASRNEGVAEHFEQLSESIMKLDRPLRLPLMEICLNALKRHEKDDYHDFVNLLNKLIHADDQVDLFEWMIYKAVECHLEPHFVFQDRDVHHRHLNLPTQAESVSVLLSVLARLGAKEEEEIQRAFAEGAKRLSSLPLKLMERKKCRLQYLDQAVNQLREVKLKHLELLLAACVAVMESDGKIKSAEAELYRAVADAIGVPVPPMYAGAVKA